MATLMKQCIWCNQKTLFKVIKVYSAQTEESIYSLEQVSRQWFYKFHQIITSFGYEANLIDDCIYKKFSMSKFVLLVLYVDDILLVTI